MDNVQTQENFILIALPLPNLMLLIEFFLFFCKGISSQVNFILKLSSSSVHDVGNRACLDIFIPSFARSSLVSESFYFLL
jgi:hypothetical protein